MSMRTETCVSSVALTQPWKGDQIKLANGIKGVVLHKLTLPVEFKGVVLHRLTLPVELKELSYISLLCLWN